MTSSGIPSAILQAKRALQFEVKLNSSETKLSNFANCEVGQL